MAKKIVSRISVGPGDPAYEQLIALDGDASAIRRRIHALLAMAVMMESTFKYGWQLPPQTLCVPSQPQYGDSCPNGAAADPPQQNRHTNFSRPTFDLGGLD
jgi:hypothetical protein